MTAGAGAMLSVACSSSGIVALPEDSGAPDAGDASHPCDPNPCGVVANPDAGDASDGWAMGLVDAGLVANPEAGDENPVVGVVPNPEAGDEHEPMGVVANPDAGHD